MLPKVPLAIPRNHDSDQVPSPAAAAAVAAGDERDERPVRMSEVRALIDAKLADTNAKIADTNAKIAALKADATRKGVTTHAQFYDGLLSDKVAHNVA